MGPRRWISVTRPPGLTRGRRGKQSMSRAGDKTAHAGVAEPRAVTGSCGSELSPLEVESSIVRRFAARSEPLNIPPVPAEARIRWNARPKLRHQLQPPHKL